MLVLPNPVAEKEGVAGYEIALNYNGVAFALMPRAASEIKGPDEIPAAFRQRSRGKGQSLPPPGGPARRPLGIDRTKDCANGIADLLNCRADRHQIPDPRGTGSPVQEPGTSRLIASRNCSNGFTPAASRAGTR